MEATTTRVNSNGRIVIPARYREQLGIRAGDSVVLRLEKHELRLTTINQAIERARSLLKPYLKGKKNLTTRFIAERRKEAARE